MIYLLYNRNTGFSVPLASRLTALNGSANIRVNLRLQSRCIIRLQNLLATAALVLSRTADTLNAGTAVGVAGPRVPGAAAALLAGAAVPLAGGTGADGVRWGAEDAVAVWGARSLSVPALSSPARGDHALDDLLAEMGGRISLVEDHVPFLKQLPT